MSAPQPMRAPQPSNPALVRGVSIWAGISVLLMVIGSFGPWIKGPFGVSVSGTDGSNDGWIVIILAVVAVVLLYPFLAYRGSKILPLLALLAGIGAAAVTIYDRNNVSDKLKLGGTQIGQVGWGLNAAMIASISLAIVSFVLLITRRPER